jgi:pimeloyl-ACP methyl ester carboxylesterase
MPVEDHETCSFLERYVDADGFRIRYLEAGQGEPLVWLHGAGGLRRSRAQDILAASHRVILFEAPGFGQSPRNDRSASMAELARTMAQATTALGLERFHLLGHSFGGRLAAWLAVQQPELLETLVLAAPAAILPENHVRPAAPESQANLLYAYPERQPHRPPPDPAILAKQEELLRRVSQPRPDTELEDRLRSLNLPVLVVFGTDDLMIPPEMGRRYRELLPDCHYILVYDAGHALDADRPEAFADLVADFLERRDAFLVTRASGQFHP